jgi:hypothetical protein
MGASILLLLYNGTILSILLLLYTILVADILLELPGFVLIYVYKNSPDYF